MADRYGPYDDNVSSPGTRALAIVPSDASDLVDVPKGVYVGTGGDVVMVGVNAAADAVGVVWKNVPSGAMIPFRPRRIFATGTTASNMLAVY